MKRISHVLAAVLLLAPSLLLRAESKPNIIFILADDLGWGDLGCFGNPYLPTPNLDELARQGTILTQFSVSSPVCSPSRAAFLTGVYPSKLRIHYALGDSAFNARFGSADFLDPAVPTLASVLRSAGYKTAHLGKWHLGQTDESPRPDAYGFDEEFALHVKWARDRETAPPVQKAATVTTELADKAIDFITRNQKVPFYVQIWSLLPHAPLNPSAEQREPFAKLTMKGLPYPSALTVYQASLADLDRQVGRVLTALKELGLEEKTIVVFSSDNGPERLQAVQNAHSAAGSSGPFRGRKFSLYEGGVRLPFIIRWPGHVPADRINTDLIMNAVDLMPTLAGMAGASLPARDAVDGENLAPFLEGKNGQRSKPLLWDNRFPPISSQSPVDLSPRLAIRDGNWKLLMNPDLSRLELYDLSTDPMEIDNKASENGAVVKRLSDQLKNWEKILPPGRAVYADVMKNYPWPGKQAAPGKGADPSE